MADPEWDCRPVQQRTELRDLTILPDRSVDRCRGDLVLNLVGSAADPQPLTETAVDHSICLAWGPGTSQSVPAAREQQHSAMDKQCNLARQAVWATWRPEPRSAYLADLDQATADHQVHRSRAATHKVPVDRKVDLGATVKDRVVIPKDLVGHKVDSAMVHRVDLAMDRKDRADCKLRVATEYRADLRADMDQMPLDKSAVTDPREDTMDLQCLKEQPSTATA